jgi:hypothetical protein
MSLPNPELDFVDRFDDGNTDAGGTGCAEGAANWLASDVVATRGSAKAGCVIAKTPLRRDADKINRNM